MPNGIITTEMYWLTLTLLMTAVMWVPYIVNRVLEQSFGFALWDPQGDTRTQVIWAERMMRAHTNAVENLVIFAPLVLMLQLLNLNNEITALTCMVYFYARLTHYFVFSFGIPMIRIPVFAVGVFAQLNLVYILLSAM